MEQYLMWLKNNPAGVTTLSAALISAAVAIIVLVISQWVSARRNRKEFLTKKLEELYLLINQIGEHNVERFELLVKLANKKSKFDNTNAAESIKAYGLDVNKKIVMLIRLYFPNLSQSHQRIFKANREINKIIFNLSSGGETNDTEVNNAITEFTSQLGAFEEEIIQNINILIKSNVFSRHYKKITQPDQSSRSLRSG